MKAIIVRGIDEPIYAKLKKMSEEAQVSLNKFMVQLIKVRLGIAKKDQNKEFDEFLGTWKPKEYQEFARTIRSRQKIDKELWR